MPTDNLDDAERLARELGEYDDNEEPTQPMIMQVHNHFDAHDGGENKVELPPVRQVVKAVPWPAIGAAAGAVVLAALGLAGTFLQSCQH